MSTPLRAFRPRLTASQGDEDHDQDPIQIKVKVKVKVKVNRSEAAMAKAKGLGSGARQRPVIIRQSDPTFLLLQHANAGEPRLPSVARVPLSTRESFPDTAF
jgi:hypothetical protein